MRAPSGVATWAVTPASSASHAPTSHWHAAAETILFVGNSFTYGAYSPVWKYRAETVTDLNGTGVGGAAPPGGGLPPWLHVFSLQTRDAVSDDALLATDPDGPDVQMCAATDAFVTEIDRMAERGADLRNPHVSDSTAAAKAAMERLL